MSEFRLGQHEEAINKLQQDMTLVLDTVQRMEVTLAEKKGERRVAQWIVGLASGGMAATIVSAIWHYVSKT